MNNIDTILPILEKQEEIMPIFVGEIGWELFRWVGFWRWFKNKNQKIKIYPVTRKSRIDLYWDFADDIIGIEFENDYNKLMPNMYRLDGFEEDEFIDLKNEVHNKYPNSFIFDLHDAGGNRNIFPINMMDFNFNPRTSDLITSKSLNTDRKNITIAPRFRKDIPRRNWSYNNWIKLFNMLVETNMFTIFIAGTPDSIVELSEIYSENEIELFKLQSENNSTIGLTINAIKNSVLTIGTQSAIPILSNYLETPTLMWGHELKRHTTIENPKNTPCTFIYDENYNCSPYTIFETIMKCLKKEQ